MPAGLPAPAFVQPEAGKKLVGVVVVVKWPAPCCFRLFWHCIRAAASRTFCTAGSKQADQDRDDRDDDQELDEREAAAAVKTTADQRSGTSVRHGLLGL